MFCIKNLNKAYKNKTVISIESYKFNDCGLYSIVGSNGSGKTTLLKCMAGLLKYSGCIYFNNYDIRDLKNDLFKDVCYIPQFNSMLENLTVEENIELNKYFLNNEKDFKISFMNKKIKKMSGGQKKRANFERFLNFDYKCLILDEPTTSLDKNNKKFLLNYLNKAKDEKLIITVTHDEDLIKISDKVLDINNFEYIDFEVTKLEYKKSDYKKANLKTKLSILNNMVASYVLKTISLIIFLSTIIFNLMQIKYDYLLYKDKICDNFLPYVILDSSDYDGYYLSEKERPHNTFKYINDNGIDIINSTDYSDLDLKYYTFFSWDVHNVIISDKLYADIVSKDNNIENNLYFAMNLETDVIEKYQNRALYLPIDKIEKTNFKEYEDYFIQNNYSNYNLFLDYYSYVILPADIIPILYKDKLEDLVRANYVVQNISEIKEDEKIYYGEYYSLFSYTLMDRKMNIFIFISISLSCLSLGFISFFELYINKRRKEDLELNEKLKIISVDNKEIYKIQILRESFLLIITLIYLILGYVTSYNYRLYLTGDFYYHFTNEFAYNFNYIGIVVSVIIFIIFYIYRVFRIKKEVYKLW